jgi:nucleoside-diphosphate-sugar epimerase
MDQNELVLVTGAGGFIGGHLVAALRRRGHQRLRAVDIKPIEEWYQQFSRSISGATESRLAVSPISMIA